MTTTEATPSITLPVLAEGETYAGLILKEDGSPSHHLILLPGEAKSITFKKAQDFAAENGGELPTRQEQALLYANCKKHFEPDWYWSGEKYASVSGYAWFQGFLSGSQYYSFAGSKLRARLVRRLFIQ